MDTRKTKRRNFSDQCKAAAALEALRGDETVQEIAARCQLHPLPTGVCTQTPRGNAGDRAANSALHILAIGRLRLDPRTKEYFARRTAEGRSKLEAIRCVKRYIAREVFNIIARRRRQTNQAQIAA